MRTRVLITVDTEIWPRTPGWRENGLSQDRERDITGKTAKGEFGVGYQTRLLNRYGLKAVFLVESLFASEVGLEPLRQVVGPIQEAGQEVQLHLHPEWLAFMSKPLLGERRGANLKDFTLDEQHILLEAGLENLTGAGVASVTAFRAGNYGANFDTLKALHSLGITFDTSHNTYYLHSDCGLDTGGRLLQPTPLEGVWEVPVSYFEDWPGHHRHAQLCASSAAELETAMLHAWRSGWQTFVIVSHGFELIKGRKRLGERVRPNPVVVARFERLCRFLAEHRDKFETAGFEGLVCSETGTKNVTVPRGSLPQTAWRFLEQAVGRIL